MRDALSFAKIDGLPVELLPTRTVLSLFSTGGHGGNDSAGNALFNMMSDALGHQLNSAGAGVGGAGGSANAGHGG